MRPLSATELLCVWERGLNQPLSQWALTLLEAACPGTSLETLAELSVGQRDACLLTLREWAFGPQLASLAVCPSCGERLEMTFNVADARVETPTQSSLCHGEAREGALSLSVDGYTVRFRLPNSLDLVAITDQRDTLETRQLILERCLIAIQCNGAEATVEQLPTEVIETVVERMAQADPQADVQLDLVCPACEHHWQAAFDIVSYFWQEINTWAYRVLRDVHTLARAYGWRETDILAMSPLRRQLYLEMLSG